jgi:hypothetical protein
MALLAVSQSAQSLQPREHEAPGLPPAVPGTSIAVSYRPYPQDTS